MMILAKSKKDETVSLDDEHDEAAAEEKKPAGKASVKSGAAAKDAPENNIETDEPAQGEPAQDEAAQEASGSGQDEPAVDMDRYLRLAAEYDNFRKRSAKEREMTYSNARIDTITRLLPVYDNLERALKMECPDEAYYKGVEMIMTGLLEIFEGMDIKRIKAVGEPFDPNRHNAVMSIENPEFGEKIVAEEFQKGFILGERVIRFSTVVVAN